MVTINKPTATGTTLGHKRALLLGMASMAMMGLTPAAQAHVLLAGANNPFIIRTDRALNRLTRLMDDLVNAEGLPGPVQPLWRRVVQHQTDMSQPLGAADGTTVLAFRAEALETPDSYVIVADLPGVKREDIRISFLDGNVLGITASRHNPYEALAAKAVEEPVSDSKDKDDGKKKAAGGAAIEIATETASRSGEDDTWPKYLMRELTYGKQHRGFKLPSDASPETASAQFEGGVLTVTVAKRQAPKEKLIEIK